MCYPKKVTNIKGTWIQPGKLYRLRSMGSVEGLEVAYTFIPDDDGDFCSDIIPAQEIVLVVDCRSQYIGPSGLEVITILFGEQTHLVCPDCLVEM